MIIDPPSLFAPLADWEAFLVDMKKLKQPEAQEWIDTAEAKIAELNRQDK